MSSFPAYGVSTGADGHKWTAWDDGIFGQYNSVDRNSPEAACRALYEGISRVSPWFAYDYIEESWGYKLEQSRSYVGVDLERERCVSEKHEDEYFWVSTGASGYWLNYNYIYNSRFGYVMRLGECADGYDKNRDGYCEPIRPLVKICPISHPVFPGTGVKVLTERDESGSEELPLARTYRSHVLFGPKAGQGRWLFEWHREIDVPIAINGSESPQISVLRADGEVLKLLKTGSKWSAVGHDGTVERVTDGDVVTWRYTVHATGTVEIYNAKGRLQSVQVPGRRPTTLAYNKAEQLISVTAPSGRALKFDYDAQGNVASIIVPDGATTKYAYNTNGMLSTVTRPDNTTRQYVYEDTRFPTALTGVIDEAGVRYASYAYDDQGRAILSELTAGADRYQFQYGPDGQTTVLTPDGGSSVYSFLKQNGVLLPTGVSAPCPTCGKTSLRSEYDANGNVARKVAYDGTVTTFLYDADGRETQRVVGAGTVAAKTTNVEWHPTLRVPVRIASPGRIDSLTYDSAGRVTTYAWFYTDDQSGATGFVAAPADSITKMNWSYNSAGQVISVIETKGANETGRWSFT
ncbi:hypothetical protein [Ralstonia sp. UBA689]|uniref:hypothetical protein n=1 Tax=Ralstonia sp. UBA689 TaxID=1947373 RepID=UPI0025E0BF8F|nr:hypothetical protein [Ralstonia sp. UBA689]